MRSGPSAPAPNSRWLRADHPARSASNRSAGMRSVLELLRISMRSSSRFCTSSLIGRLAVHLDLRVEVRARRRSSAGCRSSRPRRRRPCRCVWPGALMNSGTGAISAAVLAAEPPALARACGNATPWSAATTISDLSQIPSSFSLLPQRCSSRSAKPRLQDVALEQHVELALVLVGLVREARDRVVGLAPVAVARRAGTARARAAAGCA